MSFFSFIFWKLVLFRTDKVDSPLALHYFESINLFEWFSTIKYVPPFFVNMICFIDEALTKSLGLAQNFVQAKYRTCYNYLIVDANKFISLMWRQSVLSFSKKIPNCHDDCLFRSCIVHVGKGTHAHRDIHFKDAKLVYIGELSGVKKRSDIFAKFGFLSFSKKIFWNDHRLLNPVMWTFLAGQGSVWRFLLLIIMGMESKKIKFIWW